MLASVLGCTAQQLGYYIYKKPLAGQYTSFRLSKKRGGTRIIHAPATNLKIIQRSIGFELAKLRIFSSCVNGFVSGRDIKTNASRHVGQRFLLNIDLENFFGSINFGRIYGLLSKRPYRIHPTIAAAIAKACTLNNELPQGAPSSPVLTNLICAKMDAELSRLARQHHCIYSRYADDLTFSTNRSFMPLAVIRPNPDGAAICEISQALRTIVENNGFRINEGKSRLAERTRRQEVTGLIVNRRVNVKRRLIREVRAMLHAWRKFGAEAAQKERLEKYHGRSSSFESLVRGKIGFIGQIRGRPDPIFRKLARQFNDIAAGPKIRVDLSPEEVAKQAVWVLEHDGAEQGTAFFVERYGLVTCAHCVEQGMNHYIYHPSDPTKHYTVTVDAMDADRDLAVLKFPDELADVVPIPLYAGAAPANQTEVVLLGYPQHHFARPIRIDFGSIIRTYPKGGVSYFEITQKIIAGNSGGPLLLGNTVIGVARAGINQDTSIANAEFLAINVSELSNWLSP